LVGRLLQQVLGWFGLGKAPAAPAKANTSSASTNGKTSQSNEANFDGVLNESGFDPSGSGPVPVAAGGDSGKNPRAKKAAEKLWRPAQAEFTDADRKKILACDEGAVQALSSTITSELLASIDKIPPFPVIANKLIEALEAADVRTDVIERLVTQDAVIAAKILSTANSPFYNSPTTIETLPHAIRVIGLTEVSRVAVAAATAAVFDVEERMAHESVSQQQQIVWTHSVATARGSAWLALQLSQDVQRAYVAGLIHDIGKAVALRGLGLAILNGRIRETPPAPLVFAAIEEAHVDVGTMVADAWELADHLSSVIEGHHVLDGADPLVRIVALVSFVDELRTNPAHRSGLMGQVQTLANGLGVSQAQLIELELEVKKAATAAGKL
jgi:putative nucleotidyltransferase with HDIG domain